MKVGPVFIDGIAGRKRPWPLHGGVASRLLEATAAASEAPQALMQRAGLSIAKLALALAPHARRFWIAAGPGNNGGDGLEAALHLHQAGKVVELSLFADPQRGPADALLARQRAQAAGVRIVPGLPSDPSVESCDLLIDALLGLGAGQRTDSAVSGAVAWLNRSTAPCLAVDLPSGLQADTGAVPPGTSVVLASHTLSLLSLKPGLFMGMGRDHAGQVWFDDLGVRLDEPPADAWLAASPTPQMRAHALHKGSFGDLIVVGGAAGMGGAAVLAARAALAAGAGRVYLAALDPAAASIDLHCPELMHRPRAWLATPDVLGSCTVVCGCGGGDVVREALPPLLSHAARLLLDADALNAIAADTGLQGLLKARASKGLSTLLTPHPLEAARLLGCDTPTVQSDRLRAATRLAVHFQCGVVLKGSGTVIATPGHALIVNPTGNARLASAGTGDVLAGWIGGQWSATTVSGGNDAAAQARTAAISAVWAHGLAAEQQGLRPDLPTTASELIADLRRGS